MVAGKIIEIEFLCVCVCLRSSEVLRRPVPAEMQKTRNTWE